MTNGGVGVKNFEKLMTSFMKYPKGDERVFTQNVHNTSSRKLICVHAEVVLKSTFVKKGKKLVHATWLMDDPLQKIYTNYLLISMDVIQISNLTVPMEHGEIFFLTTEISNESSPFFGRPAFNS